MWLLLKKCLDLYCNIIYVVYCLFMYIFMYLYNWQYLENSLLGKDYLSSLELVYNPFDFINKICSIQFNIASRVQVHTLLVV